MTIRSAARWLGLAGACLLATCGEGEPEPPPDGDMELTDAAFVPRLDGRASDAPADAAVACRRDRDCDDGVICNGAERCDGGECAAGERVADGTECGDDRACTEGRCLPSSCDSDADCDDGDRCNGDERCTDERCVTGPPPSCDDGDPCTTDVCWPAGECEHRLLDGDLDGHSPQWAGACGDDCNDDDARVHPGQDVYQSSPIAGEPPATDYDYDCDGVEETLHPPQTGSCTVDGSSCLFEEGWMQPTECGEAGLMLQGCRFVWLRGGETDCMMVPISEARVQRCL